MSIATPSVDDSRELRALPFVLSTVAGSADVISFVGLGGLFVAHITGNLIVLAAHIVNGTSASLSTILSVPVFVVALVLVRLLIAVVEARGWESLEPLLVVQFVLLAGYLTCAVLDRDGTPFSPPLVVAGLLGVGAMAAQNAIAQASLRGAPSTAVMTTNLTRFAIDLGEILFVRDDNPVAAARRRAAHTWPAIVGFIAGAALGAAVYSLAGLWSLAVPTALSLVALGASATASLAPRFDRRWRHSRQVADSA